MHYSKRAPVVLVGSVENDEMILKSVCSECYFFAGTKTDLIIQGSEKYVTTCEGKAMCKKIDAYTLVECSAKKRINLGSLFEEAVRAVENRRKPHSFCDIL
jgi:hypothetical protein